MLYVSKRMLLSLARPILNPSSIIAPATPPRPPDATPYNGRRLADRLARANRSRARVQQIPVALRVDAPGQLCLCLDGHPDACPGGGLSCDWRVIALPRSGLVV